MVGTLVAGQADIGGRASRHWWQGKQTLVAGQAAQGLLAGTHEESQEQALVIWAWNIQKQQAVVRSRLVEEEVLSRKKQRRY